MLFYLSIIHIVQSTSRAASRQSKQERGEIERERVVHSKCCVSLTTFSTRELGRRTIALARQSKEVSLAMLDQKHCSKKPETTKTTPQTAEFPLA
jgi:hypothetical protein